MNEDLIPKFKVPFGIRYMSQWKDFVLPSEPHIMNKIVTGCGFTEYFLRPNPKYPKVILISPRRVLLENKEAQHNRPKGKTQEEIERKKIELGPVYYARNDFEKDTGYDIDMINVGKKVLKEDKENTPEDEYKKRVESFKNKVRNYVEWCWIEKKDIRIMVTYDSFRLVKEALGPTIYDYQIVVDEFQSLLPDSVFKSDTEIELLYQLKDLRYVCFLSATPMLYKYMKKLSSFKDLPYYELDWETDQPGRVQKPRIDRRQCISITNVAKEEIERYLKGDFERYSWRDENGNIQEKYSTELVIYCNSVKNICDIIKKCGLKPNQFNILCAKTEENRKKINQTIKTVDPSIPTRSKSYIGTVPQEGEPHKMFTFCTRTVYLGADFYSTCARTLVLSDANIQCLTVDISTDLIQILGRQRLKENPWRNSAMFRFKTNMKEVSQEEFDNMVNEKYRKTQNLLSIWGKGTSSEQGDLAKDFEYVAKNLKYKEHYVAVNKHAGSSLLPCFNELVLVAEQRAFDLQSKEYANRLAVMTELDQRCGIGINDVVTEFLRNFEGFSLGKEKMKYLCEFLQGNQEFAEEILLNVPLAYKNYYTVLGPSRCYAFNYRMSLLEKEYQKQLNNQSISSINLRDLVYDSFKEGERYTNVDLKLIVQKIYDHIGLQKTGKASDFEEWFEMKKCLITNPTTKKRENGFELIKKKDIP